MSSSSMQASFTCEMDSRIKPVSWSIRKSVICIDYKILIHYKLSSRCAIILPRTTVTSRLSHSPYSRFALSGSRFGRLLDYGTIIWPGMMWVRKVRRHMFRTNRLRRMKRNVHSHRSTLLEWRSTSAWHLRLQMSRSYLKGKVSDINQRL